MQQTPYIQAEPRVPCCAKTDRPIKTALGLARQRNHALGRRGKGLEPATRALFGAGISVCPDLPAVDILNLIGNESVPKIIINDTIDLFLTVISIRAHFRSQFARGLGAASGCSIAATR